MNHLSSQGLKGYVFLKLRKGIVCRHFLISLDVINRTLEGVYTTVHLALFILIVFFFKKSILFFHFQVYVLITYIFWDRVALLYMICFLYGYPSFMT